MVNKLIQTSLGWNSVDDRDSYLNKRIELTGTLLNNLFRNYFNKLVKEMQKQVVKEINNGSWKSSQDYESIINMTNIILPAIMVTTIIIATTVIITVITINIMIIITIIITIITIFNTPIVLTFARA